MIKKQNESITDKANGSWKGTYCSSGGGGNWASE